jgi:hypothetical protein
MLDREHLISRLVARAPDDHDKLFALRRELRSLTLPELAKRFEAETGKNAYDASETVLSAARHTEGYEAGLRPPGLTADGSFLLTSGVRGFCVVGEDGRLLVVDKTTCLLKVEEYENYAEWWWEE